MSDMNIEVVAWRRQLEQADGVTADDVMELESHLLQEMDALQRSGLRPDESFVIASRRLGHPCELAAEYSKNDSLAMWKRPARLVLWGMLLLEVVTLLWSAMYLILGLLDWADLISRILQLQIALTVDISYALILIAMWALAGRPQGIVARTLGKLEFAIQSRAGALSLVLGTALVAVGQVVLRVWLAAFLEQAQYGQFFSTNLYRTSLVVQLAVPRMIWSVAIATLLVLLTRSETPKRITRLARQ